MLKTYTTNNNNVTLQNPSIIRKSGGNDLKMRFKMDDTSTFNSTTDFQLLEEIITSSGNSDGVKHPGYIVSLTAPHNKLFGEKYHGSRRSPKTVKIEGYKSRL